MISRVGIMVVEFMRSPEDPVAGLLAGRAEIIEDTGDGSSGRTRQVGDVLEPGDLGRSVRHGQFGSRNLVR